ncbi:tyrosine-type recombinase/integrase [Raineya sp.]
MATIKFKLDKEKIYLHYRQAKNEFKFYTPFSCKKENWDGDSIRKIKGVDVKIKGKYRVKGNSTEAIRVNAYLDELEADLKEIIMEEKIKSLEEKREMNFFEIKNKFLQKKSIIVKNENVSKTKEILLSDLFSQYIQMKSHQLSQSTIKIFNRVSKHLVDFSKKQKFPLYLNNISMDFYTKYQKYLIDEYQYLNSTINVEVKKIKEVSKYFKDDYPQLFVPNSKLKKMIEAEEQRFTMSYHEAELFYQTIFYDEKIELQGNLIPVSKKSLEAVRDCYIFSFNTGIPYEPLCKLTELNITSVEIFDEKTIYKLGEFSFENPDALTTFLIENKNQLSASSTEIYYEKRIVKRNLPVIQYHRDKSKKILVTPINEKCLEIIEKYRNKQKTLLPMMTNQKMNFYLHIALKQSNLFNDEVTQINYRGNQTIAKKMPRYKAITFHSARHGFASYLLNSGLPIAFVQKLLGHSDIKTTQIYAKADANDVLKKAFEILK